MADRNRLMQMAQSTGGSPYDTDAMAGMAGPATELNNILDIRSKLPNAYFGMMEARQNRYGPYSKAGYAPGSDTDMLQMYGPEDQVAMDAQGKPIPLADPRHPMNQRQQQMPQNMLMYPQRR